MRGITDGYISEWKSFSELNMIDRDISNLGYKKEYVEENGLEQKMDSYWWNLVVGAVNFHEPLEVKAEGDEVFWRQNENAVTEKDEPEIFETRFGRFRNHNNGEFMSWLEHENDVNDSGAAGADSFYMTGNYCDMFDCGDYVYAVSNLMHLGLGDFKVMRIDKGLEVKTLYDNENDSVINPLEYIARFKRESDVYIIASGTVFYNADDKEREIKDRTVLFCIKENGSLDVCKEWEIAVSRTNSFAVAGDYVYFGQNKMITRLDIRSGELSYYTNKTEEEIAALVEVI